MQRLWATTQIHVDLLGTIRLRFAGDEVAVSAAKQQAVLATLSVNAGSVVPMRHLVDELWGERPPASAVRIVQTYVYQLRRLLTNNANAEDMLLTHPGGYELRPDADLDIDTATFDQLLHHARREFESGRLISAGKTISDALALWRGPVFGGLSTGPILSAARMRLNQARITATELRIDTELELGRHHELVDELAGITATNPTHEGLAMRLMIALHRSGRRAEALQAFDRLRSDLRDQLGVTPSALPQEVFQQVLQDQGRDDRPHRHGSSVAVTPTSHSSTNVIIGRESELTALRSALSPRPTDDPASQLRVVEVVGGPGVGTSALVRRAAHEAASLYRDGVVLLDLDGVDGPPAQVYPMLSERLRQVGIPIVDADGLPAVADQFRRWSRRHHALVVVDHASSRRAVAAVRPAHPDSTMIIVNLMGSPGQLGDVLVEVDGLGPGCCRRLLGDVVGAERLDREPDAADALVDLCEGSPSATLGVAAWLNCRPAIPLRRAVANLQQDPRRLAYLWHGGRTLADSVSRRVQILSDGARHFLRGMVHHPGADSCCDIGAVTRRTACEPSHLTGVIDELVDAYLLRRFGTEQRPRTTAGVPSGTGVGTVTQVLPTLAPGPQWVWVPPLIRASLEEEFQALVEC